MLMFMGRLARLLANFKMMAKENTFRELNYTICWPKDGGQNGLSETGGSGNKQVSTRTHTHTHT